MAKVLLTADRTMMSNYHAKEFLGFGTSAPPNVMPEWIYRLFIFPSLKNKHGVPVEAPYGLRKIEAKLLQERIETLTVDPDHIGKYIEDAEVLGVYTMDPFGLGPASTTFTRLFKSGEPYLAKYFRAVFERQDVKAAKKKGMTIILGGPGVWQFKVRNKAQDEYGIDCIVEGEADIVIGDFVKRALKGETLPKYYEVKYDNVPGIDEIAEIRNPAVNGLVEIGRGCPRGCKFCSVTLTPLRWYPFEKIEKELAVLSKTGLKGGILHCEDVLLYGSKTTRPNNEKLLKLHKIAKGYVPHFSWSHASMAAVATDLKLIEELSHIMLDDNQRWWGAEIGIETGSTALLKKVMPAKAHPFKPEEWPEVVKSAAGAMTDNKIYPACTLITGLPEEEDEDVMATMELMDDLKGFKSLIVPLFFVPLGRMKDKDWFEFEKMTELQKELFIQCFRHDVKCARELMKEYFIDKRYGWLFEKGFSLFTWLLERRAKKEGLI